MVLDDILSLEIFGALSFIACNNTEIFCNLRLLGVTERYYVSGIIFLKYKHHYITIQFCDLKRHLLLCALHLLSE